MILKAEGTSTFKKTKVAVAAQWLETNDGLWSKWDYEHLECFLNARVITNCAEAVIWKLVPSKPYHLKTQRRNANRYPSVLRKHQKIYSEKKERHTSPKVHSHPGAWRGGGLVESRGGGTVVGVVPGADGLRGLRTAEGKESINCLLRKRLSEIRKTLIIINNNYNEQKIRFLQNTGIILNRINQMKTE